MTDGVQRAHAFPAMQTQGQFQQKKHHRGDHKPTPDRPVQAHAGAPETQPAKAVPGSSSASFRPPVVAAIERIGRSARGGSSGELGRTNPSGVQPDCLPNRASATDMRPGSGLDSDLKLAGPGLLSRTLSAMYLADRKCAPLALTGRHNRLAMHRYSSSALARDRDRRD